MYYNINFQFNISVTKNRVIGSLVFMYVHVPELAIFTFQIAKVFPWHGINTEVTVNFIMAQYHVRFYVQSSL